MDISPNQLTLEEFQDSPFEQKSIKKDDHKIYLNADNLYSNQSTIHPSNKYRIINVSSEYLLYFVKTSACFQLYFLKKMSIFKH